MTPPSHRKNHRGWRSAALWALRHLNARVAEGPGKNRWRARLLGIRAALPREMMLREGETALQVGMWMRANLSRLSRCVGPTGRVILIEPDPRAVRDLEVCIEEQDLSNVTLVKKGAFNSPGRQEFYLGAWPGFSRLGAGDTQMVSDVSSPFVSTEEIAVDTVDRILSEHNVERIDYVEITVNGLELQVLEGMEKTLEKTERLFLAGCALQNGTRQPTHVRTSAFLEERGFRTKVSRRQYARPRNFTRELAREWGLLEGHVFAWRK